MKNRTIFTDFISKAEELINDINKSRTDIMDKAPSAYSNMDYAKIGDLIHENLYTIMKEFQDFTLNVPSSFSNEANSIYASLFQKYVDILTNHDVYIWLAAYRDSDFKYLLQLFYYPSDPDYNTNGPYVPLKNFISQIHFGYLESFYTV